MRSIYRQNTANVINAYHKHEAYHDLKAKETQPLKLNGYVFLRDSKYDSQSCKQVPVVSKLENHECTVRQQLRQQTNKHTANTKPQSHAITAVQIGLPHRRRCSNKEQAIHRQ